ncbi:MAG: cupin domain-containing protein [Nannocystis sp.]|nr:cupin domain-containing protein [Nannocystis sp.]
MSGEEELELEALEALALALPRPAPRSELWDRLIASVSAAEGRFAPFVDRLAAMIDVDAARAAALLGSIAAPEGWSPALGPGIALMHLEGGAAVAGADVGFVRVEAGGAFPRHRHLGGEQVLILQGSLVEEDGSIAGAGAVISMSPQTTHAFVAGPEQALIYAVVVYGVELFAEA